ncbi:unnamed protein product [Ascophyllum nodosum]
MTLVATVPEVVFSNFSLEVVGGDLTVEPDVVFNDVLEQPKNGGVLYVSEGTTATFMGTSEFTGNSVLTKILDCDLEQSRCYPFYVSAGDTYAVKKGGAVHNKGTLIFEKDANFTSNDARTIDSTMAGRGGAISNAASGSITFKAALRMETNLADGVYEGTGGAIYNRGDIVVDGDALFKDSRSSRGGAIYQEQWGSFTFNGMATFLGNICYTSPGGAVANMGGVMDFNGGSLFDDNSAFGDEGGDGGAIFSDEGGVITLTGSTTFTNNDGGFGGAIYYVSSSTLTYPDDTIFSGNSVYSENPEYCPNVYVEADPGYCEI